MTAAELLLLILGAGIFVVSFFLPQRGKTSGTEEQISREQVKELFDEEMKEARDTVLAMVNETVSYGVEKAERAMERLTNEKISAVSEFSDTVLSDINKNRDEVMFLYDMLNNKHENLKEAVVQVEQTTQKASKVNSELKKKLVHQPEEKSKPAQANEMPEKEDAGFTPFETVNLEQINPDGTVAKPAGKVQKKSTKKKEKTSKENHVSKSELFIEDHVVNQGNNNEKILELHRMKKSNVAIAKELGLGVGEVKLVIDLYEGMK